MDGRDQIRAALREMLREINVDYDALVEEKLRLVTHSMTEKVLKEALLLKEGKPNNLSKADIELAIKLNEKKSNLPSTSGIKKKAKQVNSKSLPNVSDTCGVRMPADCINKANLQMKKAQKEESAVDGSHAMDELGDRFTFVMKPSLSPLKVKFIRKPLATAASSSAAAGSPAAPSSSKADGSSAAAGSSAAPSTSMAAGSSAPTRSPMAARSAASASAAPIGAPPRAPPATSAPKAMKPTKAKQPAVPLLPNGAKLPGASMQRSKTMPILESAATPKSEKTPPVVSADAATGEAAAADCKMKTATRSSARIASKPRRIFRK